MKDGPGAGELVEPSRQELCAAYVNFYRQMCKEVGPCRDHWLLSRTARYLLSEPDPADTFSLFRFYHAVSEGLDAPGTDCRKYLLAFIKATELLETLCVNLFLQPWKREIRTLKTFTGPFVYSLLPVLNSSTIKSVLASIGYLPHGDTPSEFTLSEDANPDKAMQVGFELLLARVECHHFLELLDKDQQGPQEWMEVLQRRAGHRKIHKPSEKKTTEPKAEERTNKEDANKKEIPLHSCTRVAVPPQPKPRHILVNTDQSLMEMQRNYPDLAFRGRPLVADKPHQANIGRNSCKDVQAAGVDSKGAELHKRESVKGTRAAALTVSSENYNSKAHETYADNKRSGGIPVPGNTTSSSNGGGVNELNGPQVFSQATPEPLGWWQHQSAAEAENKNLVNTDHSPLSSVDEEQDLRDLAHRMGQSHETKEEVKRREAHKPGGENITKEKKKKWKKPSTEEAPEDKNSRKPVTETGSSQSCDASKCTRSIQSDPTALKEQKQPNRCHLSHRAIATADGESAGQQGDDDPA